MITPILGKTKFLSTALLFSMLSIFISIPNASASSVINCSISGSFTRNDSNQITSGSTCSGIAVIPDGVVSINDSAFYNADLTSITFPSSLTSIGANAFAYKNNLTTITLPSGLLSIATGAFSYNTALTSITIPDSVTSIGEAAFYGNTSLAQVNIGSGLTSLGKVPFFDSPVTTLSVSSSNNNFSSTGLVLFNKNQTSLLYYSKSNSANAYSMPNTVTQVGPYAFYQTTNSTPLTSVTFSSNLTTVKEHAFYKTRLTSLTLPNSLTTVETNSFAEMPNLTQINFGSSLTTVGYLSFANNPGITSLTLPNSMTTLDNSSFRGLTGLTQLTLGTGITTIVSSSFSDCTSLVNLVIPDTVTTLESGSFSGATSLRNVSIGSGLTSYDTSAFSGSNLLDNLTFSPSNTTYKAINNVIFSANGQTLFSYPENKTAISYVVPNTVNTIQDYAFSGNASLQEVTIPDQVTTIGDHSFYDNALLSQITIGSGILQLGRYPFRYLQALRTVIISGTPTTIPASAFLNARYITNVSIPSSVTTIGNSAFEGIQDLTSLVLPSGVTSIGDSAFEDAEITSITLSPSLTTIGDRAFAGSRLASISFPISLTQIGDFAFSGSFLSQITIPSNVTSIGEGAFQYTDITALTLPNGLQTIGPDAFDQTAMLASINYCGTTFTDFSLYGVDLSTATVACTPTTPPVVSYIHVPVKAPYLTTLSLPTLRLSQDKLNCTAGTYRAGFTLDGVIQGNPAALFSPSNFTFYLLINGNLHSSSVLTTSSSTGTWSSASVPSGSLITCNVSVSANGLTNNNKSSENVLGHAIGLATQISEIAKANSDYVSAKFTNATSYQQALVINRALWRKEIESIRADYASTLTQIDSKGSKNARTEKSAALKTMIAAQKKSAADYAASKPAALVTKNAADRAALEARNISIAKANDSYAKYIESIGYGVLIP